MFHPSLYVPAKYIFTMNVNYDSDTIMFEEECIWNEIIKGAY